jgi:hypothetical protein
LTLLRRLLRLAAGDEGRKPLHVLLAARLEVLRARLIVLRLVVLRLTVLGLIVLGLIVLRLIVLRLIVLRLTVLRLTVLRLLLLARIKRLRLARGKRLAADGRLLVAVLIVAVIGNIAARLALLLVIGRALAELLLRRRDQAEVMLGMLIIILGRDRVAGTLRVAGKLEIFFGDVRRRSPNFHVRSVGLVHTRQWILMMMMAATTFAVATPHALVLTVSHDCCSTNPLICGGTDAAVSLHCMSRRPDA